MADAGIATDLQLALRDAFDIEFAFGLHRK
jgi:hypothetical protein